MIEKPMLANRISYEDLKNLENYVFEPKYDGSRNLFLVNLDTGEFVLKRRNSRLNVFQVVSREQFPEFNLELFERILEPNVRSIILDGEMVVDEGFDILMSRTHIADRMRIKLMSEMYPAQFVAFDVLSLNGRDLTQYPLWKRRKMLEKSIIPNRTIGVVEQFEEEPQELFEQFLKDGYEGVMAKNRDSKYVQKRSNDWLKCKKHFTETLEILGYDTQSKSRPQKNLCLSVPVLNLITKLGRVTVPRAESQKYFYAYRPRFVEVEFQELSKNGAMRFPKFIRFVR